MRRARLAAVLLFAVGVAGSLAYACCKLDALGYHTRDFAYYLQFYAKLLDARAPKRYSLNPEGENIFGLRGTEGVPSFHRAIHIEPPKYLYAAVYALTGKVGALLALTSLIHFAPLLYLAFLCRPPPPGGPRLVLLFAVLYVLSPQSPLTVGYDLRPYVLLAPTFCMAMLAVHFRRPLAEVLALFVALLLVREESLLLGLVVLAYALARDPARRAALLRWLGPPWLVWLGVVGLYFMWAGYAPMEGMGWRSAPLTRPVFLAGLLVAGGALVAWLPARLASLPSPPWLALVVYAIGGVGMMLQFLAMPEAGLGLKTALYVLTYDPRYALFQVYALTFLVLAWEPLLAFAGPRLTTLGAALLALVFVGASVNYTPQRVGACLEGAGQADIVLAVRDRTDRHASGILADYTTHQAFYDYDRVYVYQRLPADLVAGEERFHPHNVEPLSKLLDGLEWIVISRESRTQVDALLADAGVRAPQPVASNQRFEVLRLVPGG